MDWGSSGSLALVMGFLAAPIGFVCLLIVFIAQQISLKPARHHSAIVLVLGDIGRSPRMMYHAESLARHEWETSVIGYGDTPPILSLLEHPRVHLLHLANPPSPLLRLPWILRAPIRILYQVFFVLHLCLYEIPFHTEILLVQNPPSIPTLALAQLVAFLSGAKLIIDWHNTGYSILAMRVGRSSPLVRIAKWFEGTFGRRAYAHLFVTHVLKERSFLEWDLQGGRYTLYDRPPAHFRRTEPMEQHELFRRLTPTLTPHLPRSFLPTDPSSTVFTHTPPDSVPVLSDDRPALIVSSTSWTADEDFSLLLTALDSYQTSLTQNPSLPRLLVVITGKGDLRSSFERAVAIREADLWKDVAVRCIFLPARDYPTLLGCADLGVSLHTSSSGQDLPMKVVDMFGCGVPVLAKRFLCVGELVKDGQNGLVFDTGEELGLQMIDVLQGFSRSEKLEELQSFLAKSRRTDPEGNRRKPANVIDEEWSNWNDNWDRVMHRGVLS